NGPWRSEKQHMYEGGLRVPLIARWPGHISANSRTGHVAVTMDLFATIAEAAGLDRSPNIDGISFLSTLHGQKQDDTVDPNRELYFVRREGGTVYGGKTIDALIRGEWKLLQNNPFQPLELYNLKTDPRESTNLASEQKEIFNQLSSSL